VRVGGWLSPYRYVAFVSDRPERIVLDDNPFPNRRLHCTDGPALLYRDGYAVYAVHGVRVSRRVIDRQYGAADITAEANVEVRRVMLELYGESRYLRDSGARLRSEDEYGKLWEAPLGDDEPLVMVEVSNSTPNRPPLSWIERITAKDRALDGERKTYFLRVPPAMTTPRQAIAWTFGIDKPETYHPQIET
jgi:hypothetical protein